MKPKAQYQAMTQSLPGLNDSHPNSSRADQDINGLQFLQRGKDQLQKNNVKKAQRPAGPTLGGSKQNQSSVKRHSNDDA